MLDDSESNWLNTNLLEYLLLFPFHILRLYFQIQELFSHSELGISGKKVQIKFTKKFVLFTNQFHD